MAGQERTNFDATKARNWEREVRQELNSVSSLLVRVQSECNSDPAEDDTILKEIDKAGQGLISAYEELGKQFEASMNVLDKIINAVSKAAEDLSEDVRTYASQFNLGK